VRYVRRNVNPRAQEWFPDRAKVKADGKLQTPHMLGSLVDVPVLVDLGKGGTDPGKVEKKAPGKTTTVDLGGGVTMEFVRIAAGKFRMGSPKGEKDRSDDEEQHEVEITRDFYLGKYAVTRDQFQAFVRDAGYKTEAEAGDGGYGWNQAKKTWEQSKEYYWRNPGFAQKDEHPVVEVSWNDAVKFCAWLGRKMGREVRLPTEAEWEYACRAGSSTRYFFGDDEEDLARYANVADASFRNATGKSWGIKADDRYAFTAPVGRFQPNAWGLYDMHGNVWQWCQDRYDKDYYKNSPKRDPQGPEVGDRRVVRGGSWDGAPRFCRAAARYFAGPAIRRSFTGLRVCFRLD
jgi:formylglycine-generating enzyme required for sulfatase activity